MHLRWLRTCSQQIGRANAETPFGEESLDRSCYIARAAKPLFTEIDTGACDPACKDDKEDVFASSNCQPITERIRSK